MTYYSFNYFDLSLPLSKMKKSGDDPILWEVTGKTNHWNQNGHKVIGFSLVEKMKEIIE
jgi:hypothetical protein